MRELTTSDVTQVHGGFNLEILDTVSAHQEKDFSWGLVGANVVVNLLTYYIITGINKTLDAHAAKHDKTFPDEP